MQIVSPNSSWPGASSSLAEEEDVLELVLVAVSSSDGFDVDCDDSGSEDLFVVWDESCVSFVGSVCVDWVSKRAFRASGNFMLAFVTVVAADFVAMICAIRISCGLKSEAPLGVSG